MTPADPVRARLSRLLAEARVESAALQRIAEEMARYRTDLDAVMPARPVLALVAVDLHDYYTAAEALFERVARPVDGDVPSGLDSHRELLEQMAADVPPVRPAVLSDDQRRWLHELRTFRHFFRHAYSVGLDPARLREHADRLLVRHPGLLEALQRFLAFIEETRDALAPS